MIIVTVSLKSAITGKVTELARMHISNDGTGTCDVANYKGKTFRGRNVDDLNRLIISRETKIVGWKRKQFHIWNLVCAMLNQMGYSKK